MHSLGHSLIRVLILLGVITSVLILFASGVTFFSALNSDNHFIKVACVFVLSISGYSAYRLNELDRKRELLKEKRNLELIRSELESIVIDTDEYIFKPKLSFYLVLFTFVPAFLPLLGYLGYRLLLSHQSIFAFVFGLLFIYCAFVIAYVFYKSLIGLLKFPLLQINGEGIHHFVEGKFLWEDISFVSLMVTKFRSIKRHQLYIGVLNKEKYASRLNLLDKWLLFVKNKNTISMGLPLNEKTARTIEMIAQKFAAKYALNSVHRMELLREELSRLTKDDLSEENLNKAKTLIEDIEKINPPV